MRRWAAIAGFVFVVLAFVSRAVRGNIPDSGSNKVDALAKYTKFYADKRVFAYKSGTDDGNPSRAMWRWEVEETPNGSKVTCSWDLRPVTFWRRTLLVRMRAPSLAKEVNESIAALGKVASTAA